MSKTRLIPCRHLDYDESKYDRCALKTCAPHYPDVKYWDRGDEADFGSYQAVLKVQFCKLRGRINGVFQCHTGEMGCYDPELTPDSDSDAA